MSVLSVRWRDGGMEAKCPLCEEFLPTTLEYWYPKALTRCRTCWADHRRLQQLGYTRAETDRYAHRIKDRMRYALNRAENLRRNAAYRATHTERAKAYRAAYYVRAKGDPSLMAQYHLAWPDERVGRKTPMSSVEARRREWREAKRRARAAA